MTDGVKLIGRTVGTGVYGGMSAAQGALSLEVQLVETGLAASAVEMGLAASVVEMGLAASSVA